MSLKTPATRNPDISDGTKDPVQRLQEIYPTWSEDDIKSALQDAQGDVQMAAIRIHEGHAEQWGSVVRKKDKRSSTPVASQPREHSSGRERGESRGGRGGRGRGTGRGGGRGGRGAPREPRETNGHSSRYHQQTVTHGDSNGDVFALSTDTGDALGAPTTPEPSTFHPKPATPDLVAAGWGHDAHAPPNWNSGGGTSAPAPAKPNKTPANSKMSWAQIAGHQEKPKPPPTPPVVAPPPPAPITAPEPEPVEPEVELEPDQEQHGWEAPTTAEGPTWDDEPHVKAPAPATATSDSWVVVDDVPLVPSIPTVDEPVPDPQTSHSPLPAPSALPAQIQNQKVVELSHTPPPPKASPTPSQSRHPHRTIARRIATDQPVVMPNSSFGTALEKVGMQFGSVSLGDDVVEQAPEPAPATESFKVAEPTISPVTEVPPLKLQVPTTQTQQPLAQEPHPVAPTPPQPTQSTLTPTAAIFQAISQPSQHQPSHAVQQSPPSLPPQPPSIAHTSAQSSNAASSPLPSFNQQTAPLSQHSISSYQHAQPTQTQTQAQTQPPQIHQQYAHHAFQNHVESPTTQPTQQHSQPTLQQPSGTHGSYFRQPEQQPYFHAPTPPAGQPQESPYGAFGLGQAMQHQTQASHLAGFEQYGYDNTRGFYDGQYVQPAGFGNRNVLGHEDVSKGLPGTQPQPPTNAGLPATATQPTQQPTAQQQQTPGQPQSSGGQPQQGYTAIPFYYNPYQPNQFYGPPYGSGYGISQYTNRYPAQQPPMFQPPAPGSASPAGNKGPNTVQPQSVPYGGQGLYGQQHSSNAYDDAGYSHHSPHQHSHQQHQHNQALPTNDYGKPMYGGQMMQGFMGATGPNSGPPLGQRAGTTASPEHSYKPYSGNVGVGKDVGTGVGSGVSSGQTGVGQVPQGRTGVQQPQHTQHNQHNHNQGAFYNSNRFSSNPGVNGPPVGVGAQPGGAGQQGNHQQVYPQGAGADNSFYYPRNQSGQFWQ